MPPVPRVSPFAILSIALLAYNLLCLWWHRGNNVPGWDLLGQGAGAYYYDELGFRDAFERIRASTRNYQFWSPASSLLYGLAPGVLGYHVPWLHWGAFMSVVTFAVWFTILVHALRAPAGWLALAVCASPALLSHIIVADPYMSGPLPHALMLSIVFRDSAHSTHWRSYVFDLAALLFGYELAFHCAEGGKASTMVLIIGAFTLRNIPNLRRAVWLAGGVALPYGFFAGRYTPGGAVASILPDFLRDPFPALARVVEGLYLTQYIDIPILFTVAIVSIWALPRNRLFWAFYFSGLVCIASLLMVHGTELHPRRFLLVEFSAAAVAALVAKRGTKRARIFVRGGLLVAQITTLTIVYRFCNQPLSSLSLPYTHAPNDYFANPYVTAATDDAVARARAGERQVFVYGFEAMLENTTDPITFMERIYLQLGPREFKRKVTVLSSFEGCRYSCIPRSHLWEARKVLADFLPATMHIYRDWGACSLPSPGTVRSVLEQQGIRFRDGPETIREFTTLLLDGMDEEPRAPLEGGSHSSTLCITHVDPEVPPSTHDEIERLRDEGLRRGAFRVPLDSNNVPPRVPYVLSGESHRFSVPRRAFFQIHGRSKVLLSVNGKVVELSPLNGVCLASGEIEISDSYELLLYVRNQAGPNVRVSSWSDTGEPIAFRCTPPSAKD